MNALPPSTAPDVGAGDRPPAEAGWCQLLGVVCTALGGLAVVGGTLTWLVDTAAIGAPIIAAGLATLALGALLMATGAALREQVRQRLALTRLVDATKWGMQHAAARSEEA